MKEVRIFFFGAVLIGILVPIFRFLEIMLDTMSTYLQNKVALKIAADGGEVEEKQQTYAIGFGAPSTPEDYDDEED